MGLNRSPSEPAAPTVTVSNGGARLPDEPAQFAVGDTVDRFVLVEHLGRGGMGEVFAAHDPELHRKVALKLLRGGKQGEPIRLLREAQALAQLSHPNVTAIYEVGSIGEDVFIAMEFVEGRTLRAWTRARERSWREVLALFIQAGRGLSAAHAAGLVHRDVKPSNIFVGDDGRVRVGDFGLAYAPLSEDDALGPRTTERLDDRISSVGSGSGDTLSGPLTETGKVMGTPAYMSPQQHVGRPTDPRSDQYSFCVALFEGLYSYRPFLGESARELKQRKWTLQLEPADPQAGVPAWLDRAVLRGLSLDPDKRWPSMDALLNHLEGRAKVSARRWLFPAVGVVGLMAGAWAITTPAKAQCTGANEQVEAVWGDAQREQVRAAVSATKLPFAAKAFDRTSSALDGYAAEWVAAWNDACEAGGDGGQSRHLSDRRTVCLDRRLEGFGALVKQLETADRATVARAASAVDGLARIDRCADTEYLLARVAPPEDPADASRARELRIRLDDVRAALDVGKYASGVEKGAQLAEEANELGYKPLIAEVALVHGRLQEKSGDYAAAAESLRTAYFTALGVGDDMTATEAAADSILVVGAQLARFEDGLTWEEHANAILSRVGEDPVLRARIDHALGFTYSEHGDYGPALTHYQRALELLEGVHEAGHPDLARAALNVGSALADNGRTDEAVVHYERALAIWRAEFGTGHPHCGAAYMNLGVAREEQGKPEEAIKEYQAALDNYALNLGPDHPHVAMVLNNLGALEATAGKHEQAREKHARALKIFEAKFPADHPMVVMSLLNLGTSAEALGEADYAVSLFERASISAVSAVVAAHPYRRGSLMLLGSTLLDEERFDESLAAFEKLAALGTELTEEAPEVVADAEYWIGKVRLAKGELELARTHLTRALELRTQQSASSAELGSARLALGRATEDMQMVERALADFDVAGDTQAGDEARAWLADR